MHPDAGCGKIYLHNGAVDMRKSFEGLGAIVESCFPGELLKGPLFVFINRRRTHIKILRWDGDGLSLWYKRLERGTFPRCFDDHIILDRRKLAMLIEGVVPGRMGRRFDLNDRS